MFILMENSKSEGKHRRGADIPVRISATPIDMNTVSCRPGKWYSISIVEEEPTEVKEIDLSLEE